MQAYAQQNRTEFPYQKPLPFAPDKNNMNSPMALADRIRTILTEMDGKDYGKQARLGVLAEAGRPVVNHWLSGVQLQINPKHARNIADKLGYRYEWVLHGKGPKRNGEKEATEDDADRLYMVHVTAKEMEILTAYRSADSMDRSVIEHICLKSARDKAGRSKDN